MRGALGFMGAGPLAPSGCAMLVPDTALADPGKQFAPIAGLALNFVGAVGHIGRSHCYTRARAPGQNDFRPRK